MNKRIRGVILYQFSVITCFVKTFLEDFQRIIRFQYFNKGRITELGFDPKREKNK